MSKGCVYYDADANRCDYHDPISFKLGAESRQLRRERDALTRRIDELCAENEQLRQENQSIGIAAYELGRKSITEQYDKLQDEHARLRSCLSDDAENARMIMAENAKLRELVKRYHRLVAGTDELWSWQSVYEELQELGIEVD